MPDQVQQDYKVRLDSFEGPLDLLLFLVRRSEVDLNDIPIGKITDQYLSLLNHAEKVDVELAGEFLVMAATLVEIKSRTIAPPETDEQQDGVEVEGSTEDPRADLIRQLLRYQRIRLAAERLDDGRVRFARQVEARAKSDIDDSLPPDALDLEDVHIMDLAESYERIARAINFDAMGDHRVAVDDTPIALHQADLVDRLTRRDGAPMTLQDIFAGQSPSHRLGLFLATLELVRMHRVDFLQEDEGPIRLSLRPEEDLIRHQELEQAFDEQTPESDDTTSHQAPSLDAAP
ncbi:MAG: segregation/condensation protein A [Phycisphaerales bacterium]|nr:segregation/condensation protein A [Phycisphaerales bacterium]|tara:strand:- start:609 stop:1475 length:867 start_codon:yes stop_codon:yes gene_type:complete